MRGAGPWPERGGGWHDGDRLERRPLWHRRNNPTPTRAFKHAPVPTHVVAEASDAPQLAVVDPNRFGNSLDRGVYHSARLTAKSRIGGTRLLPIPEGRESSDLLSLSLLRLDEGRIPVDFESGRLHE